MPNRARGESELNAGGRLYTMRLTLGALAEIEDGLCLNDLSEIEERLKRLRAADLAIVAAALMRGGGHEIAPVEVLRLQAPLPELVHAVGEAFGGNEAKGVAAHAASPFPGTAGSRSD
jgi:Phage tail tube protein, GTA-gp10